MPHIGHQELDEKLVELSPTRFRARFGSAEQFLLSERAGHWWMLTSLDFFSPENIMKITVFLNGLKQTGS